MAERERLHKLFEHAKKSLEKADYAYAHDLFAQCVAEDPSSLIYLQHFRANLAQMHPNTKAAKPNAMKGIPLASDDELARFVPREIIPELRAKLGG